MDNPPLRTRAYDIPKPEAGLAEWTSKVKALQRQVDADEEAEQRRLEEEITASRLARLRRSHGSGYNGGVSTNVVISPVRNISGKDQRAFSNADDTPSVLEGQRSHAGALLELTGQPDSSRPSLYTSTSKLTTRKAEPMSLAAFIGGRASGPRLNKHAPQQDAHDPTQFDHRAITVPHPVFGRGGVAMPGMTSRITGPQEDGPLKPFMVERYTVPPPLRSGDDSVAGTKPTPYSPDTRERSGYTQPSKPIENQPVSGHSPSPPPRSKSPTRERRYSAGPARNTPSPTINRPITPRQQPAPAPTTPSSPSHKSPMVTPSLARPIQPSPKPVQQNPILGSSTTPSPAFLRPPSQKELTPSLSRLQGRGFVQNMIKASSQLESASSSASTTPDRARAPPPKKSSVLDRWQPAASTASTALSLPASPSPIRKSKTFDTSSNSSETVPTQTASSIRPLKPMASLPSLVQRDTEAGLKSERRKSGGVGLSGSPASLGSATTMVVFKPATVDDPAPVDGADEMGVRGSPEPVNEPKISPRLPYPSVLPSPGLVHPTKDRARIPRKGKAVKVSKSETSQAREVISDPSSTSWSSSMTKNVPHHHAAPLSSLGTKTVDEPTLTPTATSNAVEPNKLPVLTGIIDRKPSLGVAAPEHVSVPPSPALTTQGPVPPLPDFKEQDVADPSSHSEPVEPLDPGELQTQVDLAPKVEKKTPPSPIKHNRIPSTGNRATVMDVAQAFNELNQVSVPRAIEVPPQANAAASVPPVVTRPRNITPSSIQAEKRKSSYEKYSAITLPPLPEESTPTPTPAGTLSRDAAKAQSLEASDSSSLRDLVSRFESHLEAQEAGVKDSKEINIPRPEGSNKPLQHVDIQSLLQRSSGFHEAKDDHQTISVDIMSIVGSTASPVPSDAAIFYDTEVLAIIHRCKLKSTGLVSSTVWGWQGKRCQFGEREERKLQELARRYGTSMIPVCQNAETTEFVDALGGQLVIRQGTRAHWSSENTAMHLVRSLNGVLFIDELDLSIRNLCSGFSYCLSILGTFYVWRGRGSTNGEQEAAIRYARSMSNGESNINELREGDNDDEEMFWMILGDTEFAKADYWQWRRATPSVEPKVWRIDSSQEGDQLSPVPCLSGESLLQSSVYVVDCIWELYVLVGKHARGKRRDIRLGLSVSMDLSNHVASSRPFSPVIHALVLPSQLPADLRMSLRDLDEQQLNEDDVPDHMNLIPYDKALEDLQRDNWDPRALEDHQMLPLGIDPSGVPF